MSSFLHAHGREIIRLSLEHLRLVAIAMLIAICIGVPLGVWIAKQKRARAAVLSLTNIMQTVPSLALFGLLLPLPWLGARADRLTVTALVLYALLPIVRNTFTGISGVDRGVLEAAVGMGLSPRELLRHVELPLATPVILAGVRTATVVTIGVATIAAAIGAGGLGELIFRGLALVDDQVILAGAVPAALMALAADAALNLLERRLSRWTRS